MIRKLTTILMLISLAASATAWTPSDIQPILDKLPAGAVHQHIMMPMRDGTRLSTHYFLPPNHAAESYPVVLLRSAYNYWPDKVRYVSEIVDTSDTNNPAYKNTGGYVYVIQDLRGDGDSETSDGFEPRLSDNEINDAYDAVESIATNAWCNGRVGMKGGSGHGMAAYMGWFSKAPHLTVCAPGNTAPNLYEHWGFENGVRRWIYNWLSNRGADTSEWPKPTLGNYYTHSHWDDILATGTVSNNTILVHDSDTWHNFFLDSTFEVFSSLNENNRGYLIMNSGTHQGDIGLDFPNTSGIRTKMYMPSFLEILDGATITNSPFLEYYVMGDARRANAEGNFRRETGSWPPPAVPTAYYMHADGTLSTLAPVSTTGKQSYTYHPTNPVPTVGGNYSFGFTDLSGALNQLVPELTGRTDILRFETDPFTEATEITGNLEAQIYVSTDVEDTTFMVKLIDVYPAEGSNPKYEAIMRESAIMGRYWGGLTNPAPMVSGTIYRLDIDMSSLSLLVETNHRIAIHITSSSDKAFEVHPNTYMQVTSYASSPTANNTLYLNSDYPSRIIFPLYTTNAATAEVSASDITLAEGGTQTFDVHMSGPAFNNITLTVARASGDSDITISNGTSLVFATNTWSIPQTVTLAAAQDDDADNGTATIEITGPGIIPASVTATENDDEVGVTATPSSLTVTEGGTASFDLTLTRSPASAVTVTVARASGDTDLRVNGATSFVFNSENWNVAQSVTLAADEDDDQTAGSAVFACSAPGAIAAQVSVTEVENDFYVVASGLLAAWDLDTISGAAVVSATNAHFLSTGLVQNTDSGVLKHSLPAHQRTANNAMKAIGNNPASAADAIAAGSYFTWSLAPEENHQLTITAVIFRTECDSPSQAFLVSDASGIDAANVLDTHATGVSQTTVDLSGNVAFAQLATNVEFRVYGFAGSSFYNGLYIGDAYKSGDGDDIQIYGIITRTSGENNDTDNDGLPNDWEATYFGGTTNADPTATAANGINSLLESYIAGLNPTNPAARLTVDGLQPVSWSAVSGRVYSIYWTSNLLSQFTLLSNNITAGAFTDLVHAAENQGFYHIEVELAP